MDGAIKIFEQITNILLKYGKYYCYHTIKNNKLRYCLNVRTHSNDYISDESKVAFYVCRNYEIIKDISVFIHMNKYDYILLVNWSKKKWYKLQLVMLKKYNIELDTVAKTCHDMIRIVKKIRKITSMTPQICEESKTPTAPDLVY